MHARAQRSYHFGGIYADLDYAPAVNFFAELDPTRVSAPASAAMAGARATDGSTVYRCFAQVQNCFLASPRLDPLWPEAVWGLLERNAGAVGDVLSSTGPLLLQQANEANAGRINMLPLCLYNPPQAPPAVGDACYEMLNCKGVEPRARHHMLGLWVREEDRDRAAAKTARARGQDAREGS
jgi:hypothetical protein